MADMMFALVRTDNSGRKQDGVTCLLMDMKATGLEVRPLITIDGRHRFNQEFFDDVRVPLENRVGDEGEGWRIAKYLLDHERSNAAGAAGAIRMLAQLKEIATEERGGDGKRLIDQRAFTGKFADLTGRCRSRVSDQSACASRLLMMTRTAISSLP
jgi:acyl-CoA dehydrogenase